MMRPDAGLHPDQVRRQIGEPGFDQATRPLLSQYNGSAPVLAHQVKCVLADINADHGDRSVECL